MKTSRIPTQAAALLALKEIGLTDIGVLPTLQREWGLEPTATLDPATNQLLIDLRDVHRIAGPDAKLGHARAVRGHVVGTNGELAPQMTVQLVETRMRSEKVLVETNTGNDGAFALPFARNLNDHALVLKVRDKEVIALKVALFSTPGPLVEQTLVMENKFLRGPTEYERILNDITARCDDIPLAELGTVPARSSASPAASSQSPSRSKTAAKGGQALPEPNAPTPASAGHDDLAYLVQVTGWSDERIVALVLADRLAQTAGADRAICYALLREGAIAASALPTAPHSRLWLGSSTREILYGATRLSAERIRAIVAEAIDERVIPSSARDKVADAVAKFGKRREEALAYWQHTGPDLALRSLSANLAASFPQVLGKITRAASDGNLEQLFEAIASVKLIEPGPESPELTLADLVSADPALGELVKELAGRTDSKLLDHPANAATIDFAAAAAETKAAPEHDLIAKVLADNPRFNLASDSLARELPAPTKEGLADDIHVRARAAATQRLFKLAPRFDQTNALLDLGIHSAAQIAAMGQSRFVVTSSETGVFSHAQAKEVYQRAYDVHVATGILASELRGMGSAAQVAALAPVTLELMLKKVSVDNPNLKNLFALTDLCACEECRSIAGAAAYLVDVLQFFKNRMVVDVTVTPHVASKTAKDVLFARRPDLGDIDLSCDNTNVPLPYIDIVCELLESAVARDPGFVWAGALAPGPAPAALIDALVAAKLDFTAAAFVQEAEADGVVTVRDAKAAVKLVPAGGGSWTVHVSRQTFQPAAELAAAPEYVNDAAYVTLAGSRVAFGLPFDLPHAESSAYLEQFGVSRAALMSALAQGGAPSAAVIAADALGLNDVERGLIGTAAPGQQASYWNTGANDPATVMNVVDTFLTFTGLSYAELEELLSLEFINSGGVLFIQHLDDSCDTRQKRIAGLDANALDRIHRFLRLRRQLGLSMPVLDAAIMAKRLGDGTISDDPLMVRLSDLTQLEKRLGLDIDTLVCFFGQVPLWQPLDQSPSHYARLFLNKAATGTIDERLLPAAVKTNEGPPLPAMPILLSDVAATLSLTLGISAADIALLIAARGADNSLNFGNLARLYSIGVLAKAVRRPIADILLLQQLTGLDPLVSPAAALAFLDASEAASGAGIRLADLRYWLSFVADDAAIRSRSDGQIAQILVGLQAELQAAHDAVRPALDPALTADENKAAVTGLVGQLPNVSAADLSALQMVIDRTYASAALTAPAFIDGLLGPYIATALIKADQAALAALAANLTVQIEAARQTLIARIADAVSAYLYDQARATIVPAKIAAVLHVDAALAETVLAHAGLMVGGSRTFLADILSDETLIDPVNSPPVLPAVIPAAFVHQFDAIRLIPQVIAPGAALKLDLAQLGWLLDHSAKLGWLELDKLPFAGAMPSASWGDWDALQQAAALFARYPAVVNPADPAQPFSLQSVFEIAMDPAGTIAALLDRLALVTGWDRTVLGDLDTRFGFSAVDLKPYCKIATYRRLEEVVGALRKLGMGVAGGVALIKPALVAADAKALRQALKACYPDADWLGVLKQIYNPLREVKRDALVAYLLAENPAMTSSDDLFDYYLIDVELCACQPTSRIVSAHGSLQLFAQRCLLGIEPTAVADTSIDSGWDQWQWMSAFRVWQANRQVFLYPENWLTPSLRDDKSEPFLDFERALAQSDLGDDAVTSATIQYLEAVDDLAFLEVMSTYFEESALIHHVFARTKGGDPHVYYYRRWEQERTWTPWQKVDVDIKADHLIAFVRNGRVNLAWPIFSEQANPGQATNVPDSTPGTPVAKTQKKWQIQLACSEFANGVWSASRTSKEGLSWDSLPYYEQLPPKDYFRFVPLDMRSLGFSIACTFIDKGKVQSEDAITGALHNLGGFSLAGCKGYPEPYSPSGPTPLFMPVIKNTEIVDIRFAEVERDELTVQTLVGGGQILSHTPNWFRVTHAQQLSLIDYLLLLWEMLLLSKSANISVVGKREGKLPIPLGTLMPFYFEDAIHDYAVIPGLFSREEVDPPIRRTFSDFDKFAQDLVALAKTYLAKLIADPAHDLNNLLKALVKDAGYKALVRELRIMARLGYGIEFDNFYHPLICPLRKTIYRDGIGALMKRETQLLKTGFDFKANYIPLPVVRKPYPVEDIDFTQGGTYASYNWELFFHLPLMVAVQMSQDQQFERAMKWFHHIFNPTDTSGAPVPQKYWQTRPFFEATTADYIAQRIDSIMNGLAADPSGLTIDHLRQAVADWRANPFEPFRVARARPVAFQQTVLMKYIDNLIAWGDSLFTQGTMESVNQATQMYVLADKLLGPRPRVVPPAVIPPWETYNQLEPKLDLFGNALLDLESMVPDLGALPHGGAELPPAPFTLSSLYFCIPGNPNLDAYWDRVADRLFKIRHCQDINGVERTLALFAPPIDPGALIAARAAGLSIGQILAGIGAPLPLYRFTTMQTKATELAHLVTQFGAQVLSAVEKRDGEALARLRSTHEIGLLNAMLQIKLRNVDESQAQIAMIQRSIELTQAKSAFYHSRDYMNTGETVAMVLNAAALVVDAVGLGLDVAAAITKMLPTFNIGIAGFGGSPAFSASWGSENISGAASGFAQVSRDISGMMHGGAGIASTVASYDRRQDDWDFQARLSDLELVQLSAQLVAAQIRLDIVQKELAAHQLQIANANQSDSFLKGKFTNTELFDYMLGQLSGVYYRAYQLALSTAHQAERCLQFELGTSTSYIGYGYWDAQKKGLLAGERLLADIKQMDIGYLQKHKREYELTKHLSLAQLDADALLELKSTGACTFSIPEAAFDLDHPGHYFRRLKTVSLTIPCVAGPYTSVSAKLSLVGNRYRKATGGGAYPESPGNDPRFVYEATAIQSVATSSGENDSGLFELNFHDERYLPFEYAGAISSWRLELPQGFPQFDHDAIADIVLNLRYTARDGGSAMRKTVETGLRSALNAMLVDASRTGLYAAFDIRRQFPDVWYQLTQNGSAQLTLTNELLPYFIKNHGPSIDAVSWVARLAGDPASTAATLDGTGFVLNSSSTFGGRCAGSSAGITLGTPFALAAINHAALQELSLVIHYTLGS